MRSFDVIILGAGQAGPPLAGRLTAAGMSVALVERHWFGGTCVNTGCMPTKTLVASARAAYVARRALDYGVVLPSGPITVDMPRVRARAEAVTLKSRSGIESWLGGMERCTVFRGHGRFESPTTIRVESADKTSELLTAKKIFINVGGRARVPSATDMPGIDKVPFLTNTSMLALGELPRHLVVIGGSYIGLEFAQMYRRFGSEVTVIEMGPRLVSREDPDISDAIKGILEREGIQVRLDAKCISLGTSTSGETSVHLDCKGESVAMSTHVLLAIGRVPNTSDLGLDKAGVEVDARGYVKVDDSLRTNVEHIWAMGDCNGRGAFTHTAYNDFEIVAANLLDSDPRRVSDRIDAYALYIDPPLGRAGLTETEARRRGRPLLVGSRPMTRVGRAVEKGETQGFMKIVVDAETKKILGAAILGIEGDEAIHGILDTMYAGGTATTLVRSVGIHPTVSELIPTMTGELAPAT